MTRSHFCFFSFFAFALCHRLSARVLLSDAPPDLLKSSLATRRLVVDKILLPLIVEPAHSSRSVKTSSQIVSENNSPPTCASCNSIHDLIPGGPRFVFGCRRRDSVMLQRTKKNPPFWGRRFPFWRGAAKFTLGTMYEPFMITSSRSEKNTGRGSISMPTFTPRSIGITIPPSPYTINEFLAYWANRVPGVFRPWTHHVSPNNTCQMAVPPKTNGHFYANCRPEAGMGITPWPRSARRPRFSSADDVHWYHHAWYYTTATTNIITCRIRRNLNSLGLFVTCIRERRRVGRRPRITIDHGLDFGRRVCNLPDPASSRLIHAAFAVRCQVGTDDPGNACG